jgi:hypothetical protein
LVSRWVPRRILAAGALCLALAAALASPGSVAAATNVSGLSVTLSSHAEGATLVQYDATFTASAMGALMSGSGTITLSGPSGTSFASDSRDYRVRDKATGTLTGVTSVSGGGTSVTLTTPVDVTGGDQVEVIANGVTSASATGNLSVSTSSDTTAATAALSLVAGSPVSGAAVATSTAAAGVTPARYTATFTTSASGGLSKGNAEQFDFGASTISFAGPAGTVFPTDPRSYRIRDRTAGGSLVDLCQLCFGAVIGGGGTTVTISVPIDIPAGHQIDVVIDGLTNGSVPGGTLTIFTSSDGGASPALGLVTMGSVSGISATVSRAAPGATDVRYAIRFTTSTSGGLTAGNPMQFDFGASKITIMGPAGLVFPNSTDDYEVEDRTTGGPLVPICPSCFAPLVISGGGTTATISLPAGLGADDAIGGGDELEVVVFQVTSASPLGTVSVSTTSDGAGSGAVTANPVANDDAYGAIRILSVETPGVLANDTAPDNDPLTAQLLTQPAHGTVAMNSDGSFVYSPTDATFSGTDTFTYAATDPVTGLVSEPATVRISVTPLPPGPPPPAGPLPPPPSPLSTPLPSKTQPSLPSAFGIKGAIVISPAKGCFSRRAFVIHIRAFPGITYREVIVSLGGRRVGVVRGRRVSAPITLRGFPPGRFVVRIVVVTTDGRRITGARAYRTCSKRLPSHGPPAALAT